MNNELLLTLPDEELYINLSWVVLLMPPHVAEQLLEIQDVGTLP